MALSWLSGPAGRLDGARAALPFALDGWLELDGLSLVGLHVLPAPVGSQAAWARMPSLVGEAAGAVARWSQSMRTTAGMDVEELRRLSLNAQAGIDRLAAWVVVDLALPIDRRSVAAGADAYLVEVEAEDNGVAHAADAIAGLLELRLSFEADERSVSTGELERRAVEILAPLLAQAACVGWSDDA